jgi:hypothetical protein
LAKKALELRREERATQKLRSGEKATATCSGAGAAEALLLDDEADADERGGGDGEERALEVGREEVSGVGFRDDGDHLWRAAARGRRI